MKKAILAVTLLGALAACKKNTPIEDIQTPPSEGSKLTLNGISGSEPGTAALNSVYVDFSADKQTAVARDSWDLGLYCGNDFRVIINNTTSATAYVTNKTDLNQVTAADTVGKGLILSPYEPDVADYAKIDDVEGNLNNTVIPAIADNGNKVIIINRGTGGSVSARDFVKVKISKNGTTGYQIEYAKLDAATSQTITVDKDSKYLFQYISFDNGTVSGQPEKENWDIVWTFSMYQANIGAGMVPYAFSDLVAINYLNGTTVVEKSYSSETEATQAYTDYTKSNLSSETLLNSKWAIGSGWRATTAPGATVPAGTIKTKFYIVKDSKGNAYKLKVLSFTSEDGGERGKPEIKYELLK